MGIALTQADRDNLAILRSQINTAEATNLALQHSGSIDDHLNSSLSIIAAMLEIGEFQ